MRQVLEHAVKEAGLWSADQDLAFPLITKSGVNEHGQAVHYYFNYSDHPSAITYPYAEGREMLTDTAIASGQAQPIAAWGVLSSPQAASGGSALLPGRIDLRFAVGYGTSAECET